jgi:magnesium transporter
LRSGRPRRSNAHCCLNGRYRWHANLDRTDTRIAMGHVHRHNQMWLVGREATVGAINGVLWAAVVAVAASLWFGDWNLGLIIALAMVINLVTAGVSGALLPLLLQRLGIDPALAGGVILTTVTDVVGFFAFLGLATVFYA